MGSTSRYQYCRTNLEMQDIPAMLQILLILPFLTLSPIPGDETLGENQIQIRIQEYFRETNSGLVDVPIGKIHPRAVSHALRESILERNHHQCIICGSRGNLEVDHSIALSNGGDNSPENLATLCDSCHIIKTRMDRSLQKKRKKVNR